MDINWGLVAGFSAVGVAAYAAGLATYRLFTERRPKVRVKVSWGLMGEGSTPMEVFFVTVANTGHRPVVLANHAFMLPDRKNLADLEAQSHRDHPFPYELRPNDKCEIWMEMSRLVGSARDNGYSGKLKIVAWVTDALDNKYESDPFEVDLERLG